MPSSAGRQAHHLRHTLFLLAPAKAPPSSQGPSHVCDPSRAAAKTARPRAGAQTAPLPRNPSQTQRNGRKRKNRAVPSSCMRTGRPGRSSGSSPIRRPPARRAFVNAAAAYVASFRRYAKEPAAVRLLRNRRRYVALRLYERTAISDGSTYDGRDDASCRACGCHEHPDPWRRG